MVLIGGESIISGDMLTGELTSVIVYALQILTSLMMVSFCIRYDHDRGSFHGTYQRSFWMKYRKWKTKADAVTEVTNGDIEF